MLRASLVVALGLLAAATLPARAAAHGGLTAPAATSDLATVTHAPRQLEARVIDGDQRLWLRVPASTAVTVLGLRGEPYLRFSRSGIAVNTNAPSYYLNRARPFAPPSLAAGPPVWKTISRGHSTSWHEDRLHALALAESGRTGVLGTWAIPLVVAGRRMTVGGTLVHAAAPSLLWLWPLLLAVALAPALLRLRDARLERPAAWLLGSLALGAATAGRLGRELYGRPTVSAGQLASLRSPLRSLSRSSSCSAAASGESWLRERLAHSPPTRGSRSSGRSAAPLCSQRSPPGPSA